MYTCFFIPIEFLRSHGSVFLCTKTYRFIIYIYIYTRTCIESQIFLRSAATNPKPHDSYGTRLNIHAHGKVGRDVRARHESHLSFSEKQITNKYQHVRDDTRALMLNRDTENLRFVARREPNRPVERICVCTAFQQWVTIEAIRDFFQLRYSYGLLLFIHSRALWIDTPHLLVLLGLIFSPRPDRGRGLR